MRHKPWRCSSFLVVALFCASVVSYPAIALQGEALNHVRAYLATFDGAVLRDILLVEGKDGALYFPVSELHGLVDVEAVMPLGQNIYGCNPCIPLSVIATAEFNEAKNTANIKILPSFVRSQKVGSIEIEKERPPLTYGGGVAVSSSVLAGYDEQSDEENYAIDTDIGLSFGRAGNLYGSIIHFKDAETVRGRTVYEYFFDEALVSFEAGDVATHVEGFGSSIQLGGVRLRRSFGIDPDYNYRPFFKYSTEARLPGTLELFLDGQLIKQQEYNQGRLEFENSISGQGGELTLVLTDTIGNRQVVRQSMFDVSNNLAPGTVDFDVSYGAIREGENDYAGEYGSAWGSVGITNHWTQGLSYQGNREFEQAATDFTIAYGKSRLNLQGAWTSDALTEEEGRAVTAQYSYDWGGIENWARLGVEYFDADRFGRFRRASLTGTGTTVSISGGRGRLYGGISAFDIADFTGGSVNFGYGGQAWYVEASAEYLETDDYLGMFTIGYRPQGRYKPRVRVSHGWERGANSIGADVSGAIPVGRERLGYQVAVAQEYDRGEVVDSRAGLSYRGSKVNAQASFSDVRSLQRSSARITSGFVISGHDAFLTARSVDQSFVSVKTGQKNVLVQAVGYSAETGKSGVASVPVPAFSSSKVRLDRNSLNSSDVLARGAASVRVARGNHAVVDMPVMQAPLIVHILNNGVNDIFVNGEPFIHNDFGAYITKYRPNEKNSLEVGGEIYEIVLPLVKDELPIYEFDRESGRLYRISELFREH